MVYSPENRNSLFWDQALEGGLHDSRLRHRPTIVRAGALWEKVFCANCGCDGGFITAEWSAHIWYVCDPCALKCGEVAAPKVDEQMVAKITKAA